MKKSRLTEEQIAFALRQAETGAPVAEVLRKLGISERRGCLVLRFDRKSHRYRSKRDDQTCLRHRVREIAASPRALRVSPDRSDSATGGSGREP